MRYVKQVCGALFTAGVALIAVVPSAKAAPGNTLDLEPGATVASDGSTYTFGLRAVENNNPGFGDVWLGLKGPSFSVCTVHGDDATANPDNPGNESGQQPGFECGRAYGMAVKIDKCLAIIEAHSYQHADTPLTAYLGFVTMDIVFEKKGPTSGKIKLTTWTAAGKVEIKGDTTGPIVMSSCDK